MNAVLFKQSEVDNPYEAYAQQLADNPVYYDAAHQVWGIYGYDDCRLLLTSEHIHIPFPAAPVEGVLNEYATTLLQHLVRLSNGDHHTTTREIVMQLYKAMQPVAVDLLMPSLLHKGIIDWVSISKSLPLQHLLKSFRFSAADTATVLVGIEHLVKIMWPHKTAIQVDEVNHASKQVYQLTEKHLLTGIAGAMTTDQLVMSTANLVGLMIQSYDAGRGLLSNALLQAFNHPVTDHGPITKETIKPLVIETLRFDPPVHHTRRVLTRDRVIGNSELKEGDTVVLILASANRDPAHFERPAVFDVNRSNNLSHLTFGLGAHACVAKHSAVALATEALAYLFSHYPQVSLLTTRLTYEPLLPARLPQSLLICL
jgi:cytochrome P450